MGARKEVEVLEDWKVVCVDGLNWQVYQFAEVKKAGGTTAMEWKALPSYHGTLESAVKAIWRKLPKNMKAERKTLSQAYKMLEELSDKISESARKFNEGVKA